jgi:hypothetical protein
MLFDVFFFKLERLQQVLEDPQHWESGFLDGVILVQLFFQTLSSSGIGRLQECTSKMEKNTLFFKYYYFCLDMPTYKFKKVELTKVDCWGKGLGGLFRTFEDFEFRAGFFRLLKSVPV